MYLKSKEICERLRVNENTLARWVQRGEFPRPVQIGSIRRWLASEVEAFIESRKAVTA